ncbi:hypothetical protein [Dermatobacter hominis]|uniref:hypothetical protein n=1 Tax=Dermatobacter hominis TaxID=2884263 RepID=UPI001D0FA531|nr:hypothetical protein [Dermatobacter hominis]UDY34609.1 hypothetical protein LH044_14850 [Dermatobacter hominis]
MPSNRPEPLRRPRAGRALLVALSLVMAAGAVLAVPSVAVAQDGGPTTTVAEVGPVSDCSPGHIVRRPDCGIAPDSPTDPGGWIQVSLFYLICVAVVGIVAFVWWRSRVARNERRAAGLDPLTLARARGQGMRRSTRSEPVAETSSNRPEASAGR